MSDFKVGDVVRLNERGLWLYSEKYGPWRGVVVGVPDPMADPSARARVEAVTMADGALWRADFKMRIDPAHLERCDDEPADDDDKAWMVKALDLPDIGKPDADNYAPPKFRAECNIASHEELAGEVTRLRAEVRELEIDNSRLRREVERLRRKR